MIFMESEDILEEVLEEFYSLAAIARPSHHEQAVSEYLAGRLSQMGCEVVRDDANNVIADLPASPGYEGAPLTILQAHTDMVCVAAPGVRYDPLKDPICVIRDERFLRADGTSLGADDGIGVAMILYVFRHASEHGPLRAILTADEEAGMSGARLLDEKWLRDASFLINLDSEKYDELISGCAGSLTAEFTRGIRYREPPAGASYRVVVGGLPGGHSGERIADGRGNAIKILARTLASIREAASGLAIASIDGGSAKNAIPASAEAVIVTDADVAALQKIADETRLRVLPTMNDDCAALSIDVLPAKMPPRTISEDDAKSIISLALVLHSGVFAMSRITSGLVETSANIGLVGIRDGKAALSYLARSSVDEKIDEMEMTSRILAERFGFDVDIPPSSPGWKERAVSPLASMMTEIFEEETGRAMKKTAIHAGLECGWHIRKNPALDMVSIGATNIDIHSPDERLELATVAPEVRLVTRTLSRIARMNRGDARP